MVRRRKVERSWQVLIYDCTGCMPPTTPMLSLQRVFAKLQISAPGPVTGFHWMTCVELICSHLTHLTLCLQSLYSLLCLFSLLFWCMNHIANYMLADHRYRQKIWWLFTSLKRPFVYSFVMSSYVISVVSGTSNMAPVKPLRPVPGPTGPVPSRALKTELYQNMFKRRYGRKR